MMKFNRTLNIKSILGALLLCLGIGLSSCAPVAPWERGHLAKPQMAVNPHPLQGSLSAHVNSAREAAASGSSAKGGGCGCY